MTARSCVSERRAPQSRCLLDGAKKSGCADCLGVRPAGSAPALAPFLARAVAGPSRHGICAGAFAYARRPRHMPRRVGRFLGRAESARRLLPLSAVAPLLFRCAHARERHWGHANCRGTVRKTVGPVFPVCRESCGSAIVGRQVGH
jgi:hypothetical protein